MRSILQYNETRMGDRHSQYSNNSYTAADSKHGIFQFNSFNFNSVHNSTGLYINWNSHSKTISMHVCMCTPAYMHWNRIIGSHLGFLFYSLDDTNTLFHIPFIITPLGLSVTNIPAVQIIWFQSILLGISCLSRHFELVQAGLCKYVAWTNT